MDDRNDRTIEREEILIFAKKQDPGQKTGSHSGSSRQGIYGLSAFILLSLAATGMQAALPHIPPAWREKLGAAPPVELIAIALCIYVFSALLLLLARFAETDHRYRGWPHLGYLGGFYFFFFYAEALPKYFPAIMGTGATLFLLEYYRMFLNERQAAEKRQKVEALRRWREIG